MMRAYLRAAWAKLQVRVQAGLIVEDKATEISQFYFGTHDNVCIIEQDRLIVQKMPSEPD